MNLYSHANSIISSSDNKKMSYSFEKFFIFYRNAIYNFQKKRERKKKSFVATTVFTATNYGTNYWKILFSIETRISTCFRLNINYAFYKLCMYSRGKIICKRRRLDSHAIPISDAARVQRLIESDSSCAVRDCRQPITRTCWSNLNAP